MNSIPPHLCSPVPYALVWSSEMGYFETTSSTMTLLVVTPSAQRHRMPFKPPMLLSAENTRITSQNVTKRGWGRHSGMSVSLLHIEWMAEGVSQTDFLELLDSFVLLYITITCYPMYNRLFSVSGHTILSASVKRYLAEDALINAWMFRIILILIQCASNRVSDFVTICAASFDTFWQTSLFCLQIVCYCVNNSNSTLYPLPWYTHL